MRYGPRVFASMICLAVFGGTAGAGAATLNPVIAGVPLSCRDASGAWVWTEYIFGLPDVAMSTIRPDGARMILLNAQTFHELQPLLQLYTYAHECGHHISGDIVMGVYFQHNNPYREQNADRIGIRLLRDQFGISPAQAAAIAQVFYNNPEMPFYLPGPMRTQWIKDCYATNTMNCSAPNIDYLAVSKSKGKGESEDAGNYCVMLNKAIELSPDDFSSIRGAPDGIGGWDTSFLLPGMKSCDLQSDDETNVVNLYCSLTHGNFVALDRATSACLAGWKKRAHQSSDGKHHASFSGGEGETEVRIWESRKGISLSVEENDD